MGAWEEEKAVAEDEGWGESGVTEEKKPGIHGTRRYVHVKPTRAQGSNSNFIKTHKLNRCIHKMPGISFKMMWGRV